MEANLPSSDPHSRPFLRLVPNANAPRRSPKYIEAGDRKILCSGLWGVARHFNYLGEGFLALSIALVFGHFGNPWAWTYFVFVVSFFTVRQRFDERACEQKYGPKKWAEYPARVPYRIFFAISCCF